MLKKTVSKILFLIMSFISCSGYAGNNCNALSADLNKKPMTLIELTDVALTCNPSTHIAWAETKAAFANLGITSSTFWPQVSAISTLQAIHNSSSEGASINAGAATNSKSTNGSNHEIIYGPGMSVSYVLWDFGVRSQQVKAAHYQLQAAKFLQNSVMQQVVLQVEQVYYQVLAQKADISALIESVKENKKNLDTASALRREGLTVIGDVYQAESALSQSQLNLEQATGNLKILEGQLALAIGVPIETTIKLSPLSDKIETKLIFKSIEALMDKAKETRSDFLASEAQVKAAEAELEAAKKQRWPTIQLDMTAQRLHTSVTKTANRTGSALLTLSVPIFSGFSQEYSIMKAKAAKEQAENQQALLEQQIRSQVWQAYHQLKTAAQTIETSKQLLKSSGQAAKQAYGQYQAGVGNILTVLTTQVAADTARAAVIQAKLNWFSSLAQFSYALGKLDG